MTKLRMPVDASPCSRRAARFAVRLAVDPKSAKVLLLNVQSPIMAWEDSNPVIHLAEVPVTLVN